MEKNISCPRVFISYSWTVRGKVKELADRLSANGIEVVIDLWDLKPGQDKYVFMEQCVNDETICKVLVICDKSYYEKANSRQGGVGDETAIISPEIYGKNEQEKFIPIVFEKDLEGKAYLPHYMKSRIYIDLSSEDEHYEEEYEVLLRNIHNKPLYTKPAIGKRPEWLDDETTDYSVLNDTIKQIRACNAENKNKIAILLKKAENELAIALKSFSFSEAKAQDEAFLEVIDRMKYLRDIIVDYIIILLSIDLSVTDTVTSMFEALYNETRAENMHLGNGNPLIEAYDFFIWELFICLTAVCLRFEQYGMLNSILRHTYFLHKWGYENLIPHNYGRFYKSLKFIENTCKPKSINPKLFTLQGEMLLQRVKKPILTKESLSNADLVLFQLFTIMAGVDPKMPRWFPLTYVYHEEKQNLWVRLASRKYCDKILPLFGATTLEDLKVIIQKSNDTTIRQGFTNSYEYPLRICDSISLTDIGSVV